MYVKSKVQKPNLITPKFKTNFKTKNFKLSVSPNQRENTPTDKYYMVVQAKNIEIVVQVYLQIYIYQIGR